MKADAALFALIIAAMALVFLVLAELVAPTAAGDGPVFTPATVGEPVVYQLEGNGG